MGARRLLFEAGAAAAGVLAGATVYTEATARRAGSTHPPRGRFVDVSGGRIHYVRRPGERPVVLVHGANGSCLDFDPVTARAPESWDVIAVDRPGFGHSDRVPGAVGMAAQAALLDEVLGRLGVEQPVVAGHSWGGGLALAYALAFPDDVTGVVLLAGVTHPDTRADHPRFVLPTLPGVGPLATAALAGPLADLAARPLLERSCAPDPVPADFVRMRVAFGRRPAQVRANAADVRAAGADLARQVPRYPDLAAPVVALTGDADSVVLPERHSRPFAAASPAARLVVVPGAGHELPQTRPDDVVGAIRLLRDAP